MKNSHPTAPDTELFQMVLSWMPAESFCTIKADSGSSMGLFYYSLATQMCCNATVNMACCSGSPFLLNNNPKARKAHSIFHWSAYNFVQSGSDHHANIWGSAHHCGKKSLGNRNRLKDDFIFLEAFIGEEKKQKRSSVCSFGSWFA